MYINAASHSLPALSEKIDVNDQFRYEINL